MQTFPITQVHALRTAAAGACGEPVDAPLGWSVSRLDPMEMLSVFSAIWLRPGLVLRAYQLQYLGNGRGVVWALPIAAAFPEPEPEQDKESVDPPPQPAGALDDVMAGIEGDGTPWSYLSASIFAREVKELGAMWHGCRWSTHVILGADPWQCGANPQDFRQTERLAMSDREHWTWHAPEPDVWAPTYEEEAGGITLSFFTYSGLEQEAIYRHTDRYERGRYEVESEVERIAVGSGWYLF